MMVGRRGFVALAFVLVVVALTTALLLVALLRHEQEDGARALVATTVDRATLPATLPFRWAWHHVVVDAWLEDADEPLGFMFDTGAPVIYADGVAASYGSEPAGWVTTVAIDGTLEESPVVAVDELVLGQARFLDVGGIVGWVEPDNPLACVTRHGVVGASLMRDAIWRIDYAGQEISVYDSTDGLVLDNAIALPFDADAGVPPSPIVRLPVEGGELSFLLDTGSDAGLVVNPADLSSVGVELADDAPAIALTAAGAAGTFQSAVRFVDVAIAAEGIDRRPRYPVAATDAIAAGVGNMGNTFLREFVVTIDWPGRTVYLDPVAADRSIGGPPEPSAAGIAWDGERVVVGSLVRGGPSEQAGLELGEVVTAVGATDLQAPTFDDFCALLTATPPTEADAGGTTLTTADGSDYAIEVVEGFYD